MRRSCSCSPGWAEKRYPPYAYPPCPRLQLAKVRAFLDFTLASLAWPDPVASARLF
ncbi:hypothetical protein [Roseomonas chloroacetimidivorans]|uniref:hypothetical protein n=1 Tax=Roseomonas chloroacetimidivorans TaxID=1766656 RepID=UPI003C72A26F